MKNHQRRFDASGDSENVAVLCPVELKNLTIKEFKEIVQGRGVSTVEEGDVAWG